MLLRGGRKWKVGFSKAFVAFLVGSELVAAGGLYIAYRRINRDPKFRYKKKT